jgi:hypothetical protein
VKAHGAEVRPKNQAMMAAGELTGSRFAVPTKDFTAMSESVAVGIGEER